MKRLVPEVRFGDFVTANAGMRAQALDASGALVDDFVLQQPPLMVHVLNAPSPTSTASLEIGRLPAEHVCNRLT